MQRRVKLAFFSFSRNCFRRLLTVVGLRLMVLGFPTINNQLTTKNLYKKRTAHRDELLARKFTSAGRFFLIDERVGCVYAENFSFFDEERYFLYAQLYEKSIICNGSLERER